MENIQETTHPTPEEVTPAVATEPEPPRWLVITLQTLAYGIPLSFLAYVLYINYLPFGYNKTFTIDVGSVGDTDSSQVFYLEPSPDLGERKVTPDGTTYRELNGIATAVFKPNVVLEDAEITVEVEGDGVSIIPPVIDFDPDSVEWDYEWDFTQGKTPEELGLVGEAFPFDGAMYFDGLSKLELPDSADKFEDGPFSVYVEWTPEDYENNNQQIIGHYNWEIWQGVNSIEFRVGRMNNATGTTHSVEFVFDKTFFNTTHSILAIYKPADDTDQDGYIELYLDNNFVNRTNIGQDKIWKDYSLHNFSSGKSKHGNTNFYSGHISKILFKGDIFENASKSGKFTFSNINEIKITARESGSLNKINISVTQK